MDVFEAIADPHRRQILSLLRHGQMTAGAIAQHFSISRPAVSRHVRRLREAGLVEVRARGREREYRLVADQLDPVRSWLRGFEPRVSESTLDAFETEVYRTRKEFREAASAERSTMEESA
jgi:DNA-binding transcriptional ArsR family regulator